MAVAFDASSESHTGTAGATTPFSWTHTPSGSPKGVLVFTFVNGSSTDSTNGVSYGGYGLRAISGGRAVDSAGEPGDCKAWLLSPWSFGPAVSKAATSGTGASLRCASYGNGYYLAGGLSGTVIYKATDPTGSWSSATSGIVDNIDGIGYGNGYYVAVGGANVIYKSSDPTGSWSAATSGTANALRAIIYGNGYYVAAGGSGTVIYKATDPTGTWSAATSGTGNTLNGVAYADGYYVAVGVSGTIIYKSSDPTGTWSAATSGTGNTLNGVAYADGYWVAVGATGTIVYKSGADPSGSWSTATSGTTSIFRSIAYDGDYWIAFGSIPRFAVKTPDTTWFGTASTVEYGSNTGAGFYGQGYFVSVGTSGVIEYGQPPSLGVPLTLPTGAQTAVVNAQTNETYAVAITVTADYGVEATGVVLQQGDQTLANTAVDDGSPGTNSVRFAGVFSGLSAVPSANAGSTELQNIDFGNQVVSVIRETTAGQGSRSIGWTGASDDVAAVYLAIREAIVPWTVGVPIR